MYLLTGLAFAFHLAHSDVILVLSCILKARYNDCIRITATVLRKSEPGQYGNALVEVGWYLEYQPTSNEA